MKTSSNFQFFCADMNFKKVFVQRSTLPKKILRKHSIEKKGLPKTKFDRINWKPWNILSSDSIVKIYRHGELWPKYAVPNQTILIHGFSKDHGPLCHFAVTSKTCCELRGHQVIIFHCDGTGFSTTFLPSVVPYSRPYRWLRVLPTSRS